MGSSEDGASGDVEGDAADPAGAVRGEVEGGVGDIVGRAKPLEGVGDAELFFDGVGDLFLVAFGENGFGGDAVDAHTCRSGLEGEALGEQLDASFGGGVGC